MRRRPSITRWYRSHQSISASEAAIDLSDGRLGRRCWGDSFACRLRVRRHPCVCARTSAGSDGLAHVCGRQSAAARDLLRIMELLNDGARSLCPKT
jgi:hypothetical protein